MKNYNITGLTFDSKLVQPGFAFIAIQGTKVDGRQFIDQAVIQGAKVIFYEPNDQYNFPKSLHGVEYVACPNIRLTLSELAATFYRTQPRSIVAVTGTNGKTSVALFYQQIWQFLGKQSASIGTIGAMTGGGALPGYEGLTTPDPIMLHKLLAELANQNINYVAMEASSHGLSQYRLDGVRLEAAAFTNLTPDHLDYHGTMVDYFTAKLRLFTEILPEYKKVVLNCDTPEFDDLQTACIKRGAGVIDYGRNAKAIKLLSLSNSTAEQIISCEIYGVKYEFATQVVGEFQAYNILCALGLAIATGAVAEDLVKVVSKLKAAPGRMEKVAGSNNIFVDYAHTPDALEKALELLKKLCRGKLIVVFGCGGNRDISKRPQMGKIAASLADTVIVTDDNPRFEEAALIRRAIMAACPGAKEIADRQHAIGHAISMMQPNDILLIAGKGHETYQIIADQILEFDDRQVAAKFL